MPHYQQIAHVNAICRLKIIPDKHTRVYGALFTLHTDTHAALVSTCRTCPFYPASLSGGYLWM